MELPTKKSFPQKSGIPPKWRDPQKKSLLQKRRKKKEERRKKKEERRKKKEETHRNALQGTKRIPPTFYIAIYTTDGTGEHWYVVVLETQHHPENCADTEKMMNINNISENNATQPKQIERYTPKSNTPKPNNQTQEITVAKNNIKEMKQMDKKQTLLNKNTAEKMPPKNNRENQKSINKHNTDEATPNENKGKEQHLTQGLITKYTDRKKEKMPENHKHKNNKREKQDYKFLNKSNTYDLLKSTKTSPKTSTQNIPKSPTMIKLLKITPKHENSQHKNTKNKPPEQNETLNEKFSPENITMPTPPNPAYI